MPEITAVSVATADGPMRMLVAGPRDATRAVIVLHQAGGLSPQIERTLTWLADHDVRAVAPDLFHRADLEPGVSAFTLFDDIRGLAAWLEGDTHLLADIDDALTALRDEGFAPSEVCLWGYSYGGRAAFMAATHRDVGAAISWYAPGIGVKGFEDNPGLPAAIGRVAELRAPWLGLFGGDDPLVPEPEIDALARGMEGALVPNEVVRYPGRGHGFDTARPGAVPIDDDVAATEDALARSLAWMQRHLVDGD